MTPEELEALRNAIHGGNPPPNLNPRAPNTNVQVTPPPVGDNSRLFTAPNPLGLPPPPPNNNLLRSPGQRLRDQVQAFRRRSGYQFTPDNVMSDPVPNALGPQSEEEARSYSREGIRDFILGLTPYGAGQDLARGVVERDVPSFLSGLGSMMLSGAPFMSPRRLMMTDEIIRNFPRGPNRPGANIAAPNLDRTVRPPPAADNNVVSFGERRLERNFPRLENQPEGLDRVGFLAQELDAINELLRAPGLTTPRQRYLMETRGRIQGQIRAILQQNMPGPTKPTPYEAALERQTVQNNIEDIARHRRGNLQVIKGDKEFRQARNPAQELITGTGPRRETQYAGLQTPNVGGERFARPPQYQRTTFTKPTQLSPMQATKLNEVTGWLRDSNIAYRQHQDPSGTVYIVANHPLTNEQITIRVSRDGHYGAHRGELLDRAGIENIFDTGAIKRARDDFPEDIRFTRNTSGEPFGERRTLEDALSHRMSTNPSGQFLVPPGRERVYPSPTGLSPPLTEPGFLQRGVFRGRTEDLKFPDAPKPSGKVEAAPTQLDLFEPPKRPRLTLGRKGGQIDDDFVHNKGLGKSVSQDEFTNYLYGRNNISDRANFRHGRDSTLRSTNLEARQLTQINSAIELAALERAMARFRQTYGAMSPQVEYIKNRIDTLVRQLNGGRKGRYLNERQLDSFDLDKPNTKLFRQADEYVARSDDVEIKGPRRVDYSRENRADPTQPSKAGTGAKIPDDLYNRVRQEVRRITSESDKPISTTRLSSLVQRALTEELDRTGFKISAPIINRALQDVGAVRNPAMGKGEKKEFRQARNPAQELITGTGPRRETQYAGLQNQEGFARPRNMHPLDSGPPSKGKFPQKDYVHRITRWLGDRGLHSPVNKTRDGSVYINIKHPSTGEKITVRIPSDGHIGRLRPNENINSFFDTGNRVTIGHDIRDKRFTHNASGEPYSNLSSLFDALDHRLSTGLVRQGREPSYLQHRVVEEPPVRRDNPNQLELPLGDRTTSMRQQNLPLYSTRREAISRSPPREYDILPERREITGSELNNRGQQSLEFSIRERPKLTGLVRDELRRLIGRGGNFADEFDSLISTIRAKAKNRFNMNLTHGQVRGYIEDLSKSKNFRQSNDFMPDFGPERRTQYAGSQRNIISDIFGGQAYHKPTSGRKRGSQLANREEIASQVRELRSKGHRLDSIVDEIASRNPDLGRLSRKTIYTMLSEAEDYKPLTRLKSRKAGGHKHNHDQIMERLMAGERNSAIARDLGVHKTVVSYIKSKNKNAISSAISEMQEKGIHRPYKKRERPTESRRLYVNPDGPKLVYRDGRWVLETRKK